MILSSHSIARQLARRAVANRNPDHMAQSHAPSTPGGDSMTYRLSPRLKELGAKKWTKLANNGARWALLNTRDEVVAWGRYLSDYTLCSASRRTDVRLVNVAEETTALIER
jgi:hypothetical protein